MIVRFLAMMLVTLASFPTLSAPVALVDTGTVSSSSNNGSTWRAGQVTFASSVTINGIEQWLLGSGAVSGSFAIWSDRDGLPNQLLRTATATLPAVSGTQWRGIGGLSWTVAPGTYWLSIAEVPGSSFLRPLGLGTPEAPFPASPLAGEALRNSAEEPWLPAGGRTGWRVFGIVNAASVPEPGTLALMAFALGGAAVARRRRAH